MKRTTLNTGLLSMRRSSYQRSLSDGVFAWNTDEIHLSVRVGEELAAHGRSESEARSDLESKEISDGIQDNMRKH